MAEFPALPLFTDAYLADCHHLDDAEHGRYLLLLMLMWRTPNVKIPNDDGWIARHMRRTVAAVRSQIRPLIKEFCKTDGNWIWQPRLQREYNWVKQKTSRRSVAAKARWDKEKDGYNAYAPTPTPTPTPTQESFLPSLNSSDNPESPPPERAFLAPKALDRAQEDEAVRQWNETAKAHNLAAVHKLTDQRRRKLRLRLNELEGIDGWSAMLGKIAASSFMRGSGDKGWVVDFEFLLSPTNVGKIMEGRYDDRRQKPKAGSATDTFAKLREQLAKGRASDGNGKHHPATVSKFRPRIA